jgi:hypothetical protein
MNEVSQKKQPAFEGPPNITFHQFEVFRMVCKEESYANAALELKSTRANIKRVCDDFEETVGRPLFEESLDRTLWPTSFAHGLFEQISPLSRKSGAWENASGGSTRKAASSGSRQRVSFSKEDFSPISLVACKSQTPSARASFASNPTVRGPPC